MTRTIKCTNPNCGVDISVPTGVMQVICEQCSTWHFPSVEIEASYSPTAPPNLEENNLEAYMPPPISNPESPVAVPVDETPPPLASYEMPVVDDQSLSPIAVVYDEPEVPQQLPSEVTEESSFGCLITNSGVRLLLKEGLNIIGRKNADLIINDRTVSRRHCVLEANIGAEGRKEYFIYDIGHLEGSPSTNGVFVSGRTLRLQDYERIPLRNGMTLYIGAVGLKLEY